MYQKKLETEIRCPLEYGIGIVSGKWRSRIICLLGHSESMHYGEIKDDLISIKDGVLAANLNELIDMLIVEKINDAGNSTEYRLTERGQKLLPLLKGICRWGGMYYKEESHAVMKHCLQCDYYKEWKDNLKEM